MLADRGRHTSTRGENTEGRTQETLKGHKRARNQNIRHKTPNHDNIKT